eukprot:239941-Prorocentrum_minimum.AAC.4
MAAHGRLGGPHPQLPGLLAASPGQVSRGGDAASRLGDPGGDCGGACLSGAPGDPGGAGALPRRADKCAYVIGRHPGRPRPQGGKTARNRESLVRSNGYGREPS